jgi:cytidylate kinase
MAILTASRQFGSGSREIIQAVAASLHYVQVDREVLLNEIREIGGKWEEWAREFDEKSPSIWERYDRSFKGFQAIFQSILLKFALRDNVVLTGRGANFLLEGIPHAYRIRVIAPLDDRIERVMIRDSLDRDAARQLVEKTDRERAGFVQTVYGKDVSDPRGYDAVFDSARQSLSEIAEVVKQTLLAKDESKTEVAQRLLFMRSASARLTTAIVTDPRLYVPILQVDATEEELVLRGIVRNTDEFRRIVEAARQLAADAPLKIELNYRI